MRLARSFAGPAEDELATDQLESSDAIFLDEPAAEEVVGDAVEVRGWWRHDDASAVPEVHVGSRRVPVAMWRERRPDVAVMLGEPVDRLHGFRGVVDLSELATGAALMEAVGPSHSSSVAIRREAPAIRLMVDRPGDRRACGGIRVGGYVDGEASQRPKVRVVGPGIALEARVAGEAPDDAPEPLAEHEFVAEGALPDWLDGEFPCATIAFDRSGLAVAQLLSGVAPSTTPEIVTERVAIVAGAVEISGLLRGDPDRLAAISLVDEAGVPVARGVAGLSRPTSSDEVAPRDRFAVLADELPSGSSLRATRDGATIAEQAVRPSPDPADSASTMAASVLDDRGGTLRRSRVAPVTVARVSVLMPSYGDPPLAERCARAALASDLDRGVELEMVVVDDCCPAGSGERLERVAAEDRRLRVVRNEHNSGAPSSVNRAAAIASGDVLVLLNDDAIVDRFAIAALLSALERFPRAGYVGAAFIWPDGRLQESGGQLFADGSAYHHGAFAAPHDPLYSSVRPVDYCSSALVATPVEVWDALGGLDPRYDPGGYDDTDLCMRCREQGRAVLVAPEARAVHQMRSRWAAPHSHQETFASRWADALTSYCERPGAFGRAVDRRLMDEAADRQPGWRGR